MLIINLLSIKRGVNPVDNSYNVEKYDKKYKLINNKSCYKQHVTRM